jgi:phage gpG-like protein
MISVEVDTSHAQLKLARIDQQTRTALRGEIVKLTQALAILVRGKLSGGVLNKRTGRLYNSIQSQLIENTTAIYGRVSTSGVPYAAIHEFGGVIKHPGSSKFQAWQSPGGWVYARMTRPHDIPSPERSYMRSSLADMRDEIVERMSSAVRDGAKAA